METTPASEPTHSMEIAAVMAEIRQMREEQTRRDQDFAAALRSRDEELRILKEQLSHSENRLLGGADSGRKLKPDTFDGTVSFREFLAQFNLVARANQWSDAPKTVALAASLRGKARSVLETVPDFENLGFANLILKLELRFGEAHSQQSYYSQFANRRQKFGEDVATLGSELERLAQFAYPECPYAVRDKIACAQYIAALTDGFMKRTLQLEGVSSLKIAIERAKVIRIIQGGEGFERKAEIYSGGGGVRNKEANGKKVQGANMGKNLAEKEKGSNGRQEGWREGKSAAGRECWSCGKVGHFRSECPDFKGFDQE
ncbi:PREDICTED: uncharacterized protein LOC105559624 [Vollenhovia emeryi]|uniref:uncharacterized protein LOC105559624 n=1 Tax=Vollenhovia emeryi TaxID=411798 RepID=UPI0005F581D5|nr:PREDICTED: uncharacterized protein LOC105559624 [Vollenhovia emeryi]